MSCPYQKPSYLTEDQKKNCYATNRGWVILMPNGKYDIVESIADLDSKIAKWHEDNDIKHDKQEVAEDHKQAHANLSRVVLEQRLEQAQTEIKVVKEKIKKVKETAPVLDQEVKVEGDKDAE